MDGPSGSYGFPAASQPEVMRAAEKDEQYMSHIEEACCDALRETFGVGIAASYQHEAQLIGRVLYHALTTGSGVQTLGEEYCDVVQVGPHGLPSSAARRSILVALHTVAPYLAGRAMARANMLSSNSGEDARETSGPDSLSPPEDVSIGGVYSESGHYSTSVRSADFRDDPLGPRGGQARSPSFGGEREVAESPNSSSITLAQPPVGPEALTPSAETPPQQQQQQQQPVALSLQGAPVQPVHAGLFLSLKRTFLRSLPFLLPALREGAALLLRTHLMLFYFEGDFLHLAKRVAGIRYIFSGRPAQQRPRYHLLGIFLLVQLTILGGSWLSRNVLPHLSLSVASSLASSSRVPVLDEDGRAVTLPPRQTGPGKQQTGGLGSTGSPSSHPRGGTAPSPPPPSSNCALCLSERKHPTATTCGHVFCWICIAEWCNEKPECPLCRSPISHSSLVPVCHADF